MAEVRARFSTHCTIARISKTSQLLHADTLGIVREVVH